MRLKNKGMGQRLVTGQGDRVGTLCRVELRLAKSMRRNWVLFRGGSASMNNLGKQEASVLTIGKGRASSCLSAHMSEGLPHFLEVPWSNPTAVEEAHFSCSQTIRWKLAQFWWASHFLLRDIPCIHHPGDTTSLCVKSSVHKILPQ